ncbi:low molecular weight phosphatase family protein [Consotaella salsifontis]|uniref:Protein-tyrosine-phosphatase n=1 Tax=Consotaella salsifontis TaxID=1365950 RepID=A0A1T4Q3Z8_9HYPH|nr:low molecular weight phosphatase family protein [Consotaella salsifontis]SJZ98241.1 Protein-tyrosine-phosphatase [Consotaella salsifontis]
MSAAPLPGGAEKKGRGVSSVLFVCGLNSIRSPIAEALAKNLLPASVYVASAGVKRGERDPFVDTVLSEKGISLGNRRPQSFEEIEDSFFDLVVTLSPEAHHMVLNAMRADAVDVEFWPMPDPAAADGTREQILSAYRDVVRRIETRIRQRLLSDESAA